MLWYKVLGVTLLLWVSAIFFALILIVVLSAFRNLVFHIPIIFTNRVLISFYLSGVCFTYVYSIFRRKHIPIGEDAIVKWSNDDTSFSSQ